MSSRKILIVEDDPGVMRMYVRTLTENVGGLEILKAANTDLAWELFQSNPDIQVVILDGSPTGKKVKNTAELARCIKQSSDCRLVAIVGSRELSRVLVALCQSSLEKPFDTPSFLVVLGLA